MIRISVRAGNRRRFGTCLIWPIMLCSCSFLISCALLNPISPPSPYRHLSESAQMYSIIFDSLMGSPHSNAHVPGLPPISDSERIVLSATEQGRHGIRFTDSMNALPDSILRLQVLVGHLTRSSHISVLHRLHSEEAEVYAPLLRELDSLRNTSPPLDVRLIHSRYRYHLFPLHSLPSTGFRGFFPEVKFSPIISSDDGIHACIYTELWCGPLCGEGRVWLLSKSGDAWRLVRSLGTWIS